MQDLRRLSRLVANNNPKSYPVIDHLDENSLECKLYHIFKSDKIISDEEACYVLYGEKKITASYRMLKSRLRKKLLNSLIFSELTENYFGIKKVRQSECFNLLQQANKLLALSENVLAENVADQVVSLAIEAELNDMLVKAYEIKQSIDLFSHNRKQFERNFKLLENYYYLESKERAASLIFNKLKFEVNINISNNRKQGAAYQKSLTLLKQLWEETGSSKIYDFYHMLRIGYCQILGDFKGIIDIIEEGDRLLENGKINKIWFNYRFNNYIRVYAYLRDNKLEKGLYYAKLHLNNFKEGTHNWFAFLENYLLISFHKKDYKLASDIYQLAIKNGILDYPIISIKERWVIFRRMLKVLTQNDKSLLYSEIIEIKEDDVAFLLKDKEGLNLVILIIEVLEVLPKLDLDDMDRYADKLRAYTAKYLKGSMAVRAKLFIKLLLISLEKDSKDINVRGEKTLMKLINTPIPGDAFAEVEIVPYEHLWELVLELLKKRQAS